MFFGVCVAASIWMPWQWQNDFVRLLAWGVTGLGVSVMTYGLLSSGGASGLAVLADPQNRLSLPNLVIVCWFVVIVSAYLAAALFNFHLWDGSSPDLPLDIKIPASIWVLAGISVSHLAGTNIVVENKKLSRTLAVNAKASDARPVDMFSYDEVGAANKLDLTAVQYLLFQIAAVIVYSVALGMLMFKTDVSKPILQFPIIPDGFLALLGVSAAGNLVNRAVPR